MEYKYLIAAPVPEPSLTYLRALMDTVAQYTELDVPYKTLVPHLTFHAPLLLDDMRYVSHFVECVVSKMSQPHIETTNRLAHFGKQYIVLPVIPNKEIARFWIGLSNFLAGYPGYVPPPFHDNDTLHITISKKTDKVFDMMWPSLMHRTIDPLSIFIDRIVIYKKPSEGGEWEICKEYEVAT